MPDKRFLGGRRGDTTYTLQDVLGNEYPKTLMHITETGSKYMKYTCMSCY